MKEKHLILKAGGIGELLALQIEALKEYSGWDMVFKRYFLSDPSQKELLPREETCPVSYIVQPPLDGSAAALWIFLARDCGTELIFSASLTAGCQGSSASETSEILEKYQKYLESRGMNFPENCVRTWFYVNDIDNNYAGLVSARKENFEGTGLCPETHYIASTGIAGTSPVHGKTVQMDAYAIQGDFRQTYLYAPMNMNPTYEYGVTFERGVALDFPDGHRQILISGTASIDNKGNVLHVGDVRAQAERMLENIEALLAEGGCGLESIRLMIVYLRNEDDYSLVAPMFAERFPKVPHVITHAPVCRPDWLIEAECIATAM